MSPARDFQRSGSTLRLVLAALSREPASSVTALASAIGVPRPSVSRVVALLVKHDLAEKIGRRVGLTGAGLHFARDVARGRQRYGERLRRAHLQYLEALDQEFGPVPPEVTAWAKRVVAELKECETRP